QSLRNAQYKESSGGVANSSEENQVIKDKNPRSGEEAQKEDIIVNTNGRQPSIGNIH
ncbi:hypothetical protein CHS0354_033517, partial [Potamilus streckersoni]